MSKHGRRKYLASVPEQSRAFYASWIDKTQERVDAMKMNGQMLVSRAVYDALRREIPQSVATIAPGLPPLDGVRVIVSDMLPFHRKRPSPHKQRWIDKLKRRAAGMETEISPRLRHSYLMGDFPIFKNPPYYTPTA